MPEADPTTTNTAAKNAATAVINYVLRKKQGTVDDPVTATSTVVPFLLGDTFHATPQVIGTPANVFYFAADYPLNGADGGTCAADPADNENKGYRCFFERQRLRRKLLLIGANDGQLHVLDAGRFRGHDTSDATDYFTKQDLVDRVKGVTDPTDHGSFDNGTGLELFSYIPRSVMRSLADQSGTQQKHYFSVDGNVTVADVFIDPLNDGATFPNDADREWRTVAIGSLREGGLGYYALDLTQPDPLTTDADVGFVPDLNDSQTNNPAVPPDLPGCLTAGTSGCEPVPFPSVAWEFDDSFYDETTARWYKVDEDLAWMADPDSPFTGTVPDPAASTSRSRATASTTSATPGRPPTSA